MFVTEVSQLNGCMRQAKLANSNTSRYIDSDAHAVASRQAGSCKPSIHATDMYRGHTRRRGTCPPRASPWTVSSPGRRRFEKAHDGWALLPRPTSAETAGEVRAGTKEKRNFCKRYAHHVITDITLPRGNGRDLGMYIVSRSSSLSCFSRVVALKNRDRSAPRRSSPRARETRNVKKLY